MRMRVAAFGCAVLLCPSLGLAQPSADWIKFSCGEIQRSNTSHQFGQFGLWLEYIVATSRPINACSITLSADAHVPGAEQSSLSEWGWFAAVARKQVMVPFPGVWQTNGFHDFTFHVTFVPPLWVTFQLPPSVSHAQVTARTPRDPEHQCYELSGSWDGFTCTIANSPLIVDTGFNGYTLTDPANGVLFDLDADGIKERVAWTAPDSDDAFLVLDRNGNGTIDDGSELFGNHTPAYPDSDVTTANGFDALRFLETPAYGISARNTVIDSYDAAYGRLMLWYDRNHNGISEPDELQPIAESGLRAIHTNYKTSRRRDQHGNEFRQRAKGVWDSGEFYIYDVWLRTQR